MTNEAQILLQVMSRPQYAGVVQAAADGDQSALSTLLSAAGYSNPTQADIDNAKGLASAFDRFRETESNRQTQGKVRPSVDMGDPEVQANLKDTQRHVRNLALGSPQEMAAQAAAMAAQEGLDYWGDTAENNGNRLAAALMASHRTNSNRQNEIYGPSKIENAYGAVGQEYQRKGYETKRATQAVSNLIDRILGTYQQAKSLGTTTAVGNTFGNIPASGFDMASQGMRTTQKLNKR